MANNCKFELKQYQVSYNGGISWQDVVPNQFEKGELIEYDSQDCAEIETQYRWRTLDGQYICDGDEKWTKQIQEESYNNGATWYTSYPTVYQKGVYVGIDSDFCNEKFIGHYVPNEGTSIETCPKWYRWDGYKCVYVDPLKVVKCNGDPTLTSATTKYYTTGYTLISAEIGDCVSTIDVNAFRDCSGLTSCTIGSGVTSIGLAAFRSCRSLQSVHIPSACTKFHGYCFSGCTTLSSVTIDTSVIDSNTGDGNWYYGQFSYCVNLREVSFPNLVSGCIPPYCFSSCHSLSSVTLSNPTCISNAAFVNCISLTSIDLGSNVTSIGSRAFESCSALTDVYIRQTANILSGVYNNSFPSRTRIHVPCEAWGYWYKAFHIDNNKDNEIVPIENDCLTIDWRAADINTEYECVGVDKHYKEYKYVSNDSGTTWYKTSETRAGSLYEANSLDCGYIPQTYTVKYTFINGTESAITNTTAIEYNASIPTSNVVKVEIGTNATSIGSSAFKNLQNCKTFTIPSNNSISSVTSSTGLFLNYSELGEKTTLDLRNLTGLTSVGAADFSGCNADVLLPSTLASMSASQNYPCFKSLQPSTQYVITFASATPPTVYNSQYIFAFANSSDTYQKFLIRVPSGSTSAYSTAFSGSLSKIIIEEY